jgi:hypothetical protein
VISFVTNIFLHPLFFCYNYFVFSLLLSHLSSIHIFTTSLSSFCRFHSLFCFSPLTSSSSPSPLHLPILFHHSFLHLHLHHLLLFPHYAVYRYLSMRQAGKGVILEVASQDLKKKIEKILKAEQAARTSVSTYRLISYFIYLLRMLGVQLFSCVPLQLLYVMIVVY